MWCAKRSALQYDPTRYPPLSLVGRSIVRSPTSASSPTVAFVHSGDPDCWISLLSAASSSDGSMVTISVTPTLLDVEGKWSRVATCQSAPDRDPVSAFKRDPLLIV